MQRFFIRLSYRGTAYHGWQIQDNTSLTVQQVMNEKISMILSANVSVTGCGRTDTGVHASEFYAHFDCDPPEWMHDKFVYRLNAVLPFDIAVQQLYRVDNELNSRFDAISRTYKYFICPVKDPFRIDTAWYFSADLDITAMNAAAAILSEYNDFSCFSKSNTQTLTNICRISEAYWTEQDGLLVFTISADRFLRNMVRAIVGTLVAIGEHRITIDQFREVIEGRDRSKAGVSVPAEGLFLTAVNYPGGLLNER